LRSKSALGEPLDQQLGRQLPYRLIVFVRSIYNPY
jgi:hypothetical protein